MELANNTRIWENNGHTPNEIFEKYEKPHMLYPKLILLIQKENPERLKAMFKA